MDGVHKNWERTKAGGKGRADDMQAETRREWVDTSHRVNAKANAKGNAKRERKMERERERERELKRKR